MLATKQGQSYCLQRRRKNEISYLPALLTARGVTKSEIMMLAICARQLVNTLFCSVPIQNKFSDQNLGAIAQTNFQFDLGSSHLQIT